MPKPPSPHGPALHRKFLQASNACTNPLRHAHPARPLLPPLTAVDRKFLQASNACTNPLRPHRPHRLQPHPARPLLPPLTALDCSYRPPMRAQTPPPTPPSPPLTVYTHPARPLLPPHTAVDRKFLQASNACLTPQPARPLLHASTQIQPKYAVFLFAGFDACFCLLWAKLGIVQRILCRHCTQDISFSNPIRFRCGFDTWKSTYFLHTESAQRHIARVDQHSSIGRLGVGGTGGSH